MLFFYLSVFTLAQPVNNYGQADIQEVKDCFASRGEKMLHGKQYSKPLLRWMWFNEQRHTHANVPAARYYYDAWNDLQKMMNGASDLFSGDWVPAGPLDNVPSPDPESIHNLGRLNCIAFHPSDPNIFWVGAPQGGIWKTVNGGQSWMPLGDNLPLMKISDIAVDPQDPDVLYISIGDYGYLGFFVYYMGRPTSWGLGVYKSTDGGNTWEPTGLAYQIEDNISSLVRRVFIHPSNSSELLAAGVNGVFRSSDAGETWTQTNSGFIWDIEQQPGNPDVYYASTCDWLGGVSSVVKSMDFGETWQTLNTGIPETDTVVRIEVAVAPSDTDYVYATCSGYDDAFYAFYKSEDAGESWAMQSDSSQLNIFGQTNGDPSNKLAQASYDLWLMVDPDNPERVFSGAMNIWGSEDGGQTWDICSFGLYVFGVDIHFDHHFIRQNPLDGLYYLGTDGGLYRTDSLRMGDLQVFDSCWVNGYLTPDCYHFDNEWEDLSGGLVITEFYRLGLSRDNPGYVIAGSQDNCTFYRNNNEEWINVTNGDGMECFIEPSNTDVIYASNQFGTLYKSVNGGQNMTSYFLTGSILNQEGLGVWITPFAMDQNSSNTIYAGFRNLWRSDQGGSGWYKISNFPNMPGSNLPKPIWDFALAPTDPDVIYVSKQPYPFAGINLAGEMWRTTDGGDTWTNISSGLSLLDLYINDIAVAEDPMEVYIACAGFMDGKKVYRSENGGQNWDNISGSLPNIPVTSVVYQLGSPLGDIYIGTDMGVYFMNDQYSGWEPYNTNLPNIVINELEIQYAESKLYAATYGRGVWVSGLMTPVTGLSKMEIDFENSTFCVSPNPSDGILEIELESRYLGEVPLEIIDITGTIVHHEKLMVDSFVYMSVTDVTFLPCGLYFVRVSVGNASRCVKLVLR